MHEVTSIITFDCRDNYSDIQQNSKAGSAQKRKMHVERLYLQQFLFHRSVAKCFIEKKKQTTFCIILRRMTKEKGARAVGIILQGAGIRQGSRFPENVYKSRSPADKCRR